MKRLRAREDATPEEPEPAWTGTTWDYRTLNLNWKAGVAFEGEFNKLGQQGWEFVAMVERGNVHRAIFKRPGNDESHPHH